MSTETLFSSVDTSPSESSDEISPDDIMNITAALSRPQEDMSLGAVQCLNRLLEKNRKLRSFLVRQDPPTILQRLASLMTKHPISTQLLYEVLISFWLLSFQPSTAALFRDWGIIPLIKSNCASSSTEKIIRVGLATFKNLLLFAKTETSSLLIGCKVLEWTKHLLSLKRFTDEEMLSDLQFLQTELSSIYQSLRFVSIVYASTFDKYASEVKSGMLSWTPPHRSDVFWKMHVDRLLDNDRELLRYPPTELLFRRLILHLGDPSMLVKAVAVHDIGQFIKFHPDGQRILEECNGKVPMLSLLECSDANVKFEALTAVQAYMLHVQK